MACGGSRGYRELDQGQLAARDLVFLLSLTNSNASWLSLPPPTPAPRHLQSWSGISVTNPRFSLKWGLKGWQPHSHMAVCLWAWEGRGGAEEGKYWLAGLCGTRSQIPKASHLQKVGLAKTSPHSGPAKPPQATGNVNTKTFGGRGEYSTLFFCRQLAQEDLKLNLYPDSAAKGNEARRLREPACD